MSMLGMLLGDRDGGSAAPPAPPQPPAETPVTAHTRGQADGPQTELGHPPEIPGERATGLTGSNDETPHAAGSLLGERAVAMAVHEPAPPERAADGARPPPRPLSERISAQTASMSSSDSAG